MIRLSANLSKKVPLQGIQYSSQQYGASLEIEVSDADRPEAIQARIRELYTLLSNSIDEQIGVRPTAANGRMLPPPAVQQQPAQPLPPPQRNGYVNGRNRVATVAANSNGNGRSHCATQAQQRAIFAIAKSMNLDLPSLLADFNCADVSQLAIRDASTLIDSLKARQNGAR